MAINPAKFLPPAKGGALTTISKSALVASPLSEKATENLSIIKVKSIQVQDILKGTLASEKKTLDDKKRLESGKRIEKQEEKLETKPNLGMGQMKMPKAPKLGIFDWIKNFISNVILGYFAVRLIKHLPKIMPVVKFLGNAADFIIDVGGKLLNGLATFIDWGYKAYDATRGFIKQLGGENFAQGFDKFIGAIDTALFLTTVLAGDLALEAMTGGGDSGIGDFIKDKILQRGAQQAATSAAGQAGGAATQAGGLGAGAVAGIVAGAGLLASALGEGAFQVRKFAVKPIQKLENDQKNDKNPLSRIGRGVVLNMVRPLFGLFQTVGFLLDVVGAPFRYAIELLRYPFLSEEDKVKQANNLAKLDGRIREDIRRALNMLTLGFAFKEKGSFGNIYGNKGAQKEMMGKMASGGITRGGKTRGRVKREIGGTKKKGKYKRTLAQKPTETKFKTTDKSIKKVSEDLDKTKYFGPVLAVSAKILEKEKPTQKDYENVGLGLNLLIAKGVEDGQLKGGLVAAFADGGMVDDEFLSAAERGSDISNWVAKTFKGEIESKVEKNLRLIRERSEEKGKTSDPTLEEKGSEPGAGGMTKGTWGPLLDLIAGKESGGNYEAMYPSTTLPGATKMTIADVARRATGAVGKYQQLPQYLVGRAKAAGLNPDKDLYSPENQEKIIINVNIKGRGGERWLRGEISDEQFMQGLSQEFASLPNAQGRFYYPGQRSAMTADKVKTALSKVKKGGYSQEELAMGRGPSIELGKGYGGEGSKIAGELGRFMKKKGVVPGSIHRHPEHLPWSRSSGHSKNSYHYQGRAIDLGGYTREQGPILAAIAEFNKLKGVKPVELIHGGTDPRGHGDHVHVAYAKGGRVNKPTFAMLGEKGPEFVFDADTTAGLDKLAPQLLDRLNIAKTKPQLSGILQSYATYEQPYGSSEIVEVPVPIVAPVAVGGGDAKSSGMSFMGGGEDPFETLYMGG